MKAVKANILVQSQKGSTMKEKIGDTEFVIPTENNEFDVAKVISVGSEVVDVKEGDTIYMYKTAGHKFMHEMQEYKLINITDVLVVL